MKPSPAEQLIETCVKCETRQDYDLVFALYRQAGCPIWPLHKGYKEPSEDHHNAPYYGWENQGFMKHIFRYASDSKQVLSIGQLFEIVRAGGDNDKNIVLFTKAEICSGHSRLKFAEGLIKQLPSDHDDRNTWLLNYGESEEAKEIRGKRQWT